jgi:hypothetical protein
MGSVRIGVDRGCAAGIAMEAGQADCSLKRSLALRPGSALWLFSGRDKLLQLPDKATTSTRTEIFRTLFIIIHLLSDIHTARRNKTIR